MVIEATMFVTYAVVNVWTGIKQAGNDPTGIYTRITGCDPAATFSIIFIGLPICFCSTLFSTIS